MSKRNDRIPAPGRARTTLNALVRGLRVEARLMTTVAGLVVLGAVADSALPIIVASIASRLFDHSADVLALGGVLIVTVIIGVIVDQFYVTASERFSRRVGVHLRTQLAQLEAGVPGIEHHERAEYVDRLALLRNKSYALELWYASFFQTAGTLLRLAFITVIVAVSVPTALLLLPVLLLPSCAAVWRSGVGVRVERATEGYRRRANYAVELASDVAYAKDVRIMGLQDRILQDYRTFHGKWYSRQRSTRVGTMLTESCCWIMCGIGLLLVLVTSASASSTSIVVVAIGCTQIAAFTSTTAGEAAYLRQWTDAAASLAWLENLQTAQGGAAGASIAATDGPAAVSFHSVSFRYPDAEFESVRDVSFDLAPGTVAAIVGVNGAGKSTLLALLAKFFTPTSGHISLFGRDLADMASDDVRAQMTVAYQDFVKFEYPLLKSVGIGQPPGQPTTETQFTRGNVTRAVDLAGLTDRVERLPSKLDTQLGPTWPDGVDLSGGEWQKVALARAHMRPGARIVVLDEPSSALDADTERELFERVIAAAHQAKQAGGVTLIVTHRLSSARSADVVLVLDGGELVQSGSHAQLMGSSGVYRDLYTAQARGFA